jgi:hypothetical protein
LYQKVLDSGSRPQQAIREQAQLAIDKMPGLFWTIGVKFSIEDDDS